MRELFLLDPDIVFLNHGSFGACPRAVFEAYQSWQRELERRPVEFLGRRSGDLLAASRGRLADLLHTEADRLVYVTNATTGVNTVARSLGLGPGDEVVTTDHEYGACDHLWAFVARRTGARIVRASIPLPVPPASALAEQIWAAVTPATRALFLSHITSTSAVVLPVEELCRRARRAGILTIIDGAHAPGQIDLDLDALDADFYVGNCHKWLCAPKAAGFLHVARAHRELLDAVVVSWGYGEDTAGHTDFDAYLSTSAFVRRHQWQGTRDIAAFLSVPTAIDFQAEHDWPRVRERCHDLAIETRDRVGALTGLAPIARDDDFAQMVAVPLPPLDRAALKTYLYDVRRIEVPITTCGSAALLRVSFQAYNTRADADALVAVLAEWLGRSA